MANLYDKAGLVNIPVGYQEGFLYNIKPEDNTLGFRFNRDSAATRVNKEGLIEQVGYFGPELVKNGNFSELGSELIPDGNFTNQAAVDYWQIADTGGVERATKSLENGFMRLTYDIANGSALYKSGIVTSGKSYKVTFRAKGTANSNFNSIGDNVNIPSNPQYVVSNPTLTDDWQDYEFYVPVSSTTLRLYLTSAQIGDTLDITNISVKQVDPNDYWILAGSNVSISDNKLNFVNAVTNSEFVQQIIVAPIGKTYKITLEVSNLGSGESIKIRHPFQDTTINTNGFHTIYGVGDLANVFRITPNSTTATFSITNISVVEVKGDKPRIDYTDSLTSPSFLLEPQSTNLLEFSEDFSQSAWLKTNLSILSDSIISPEGILSAGKLIPDTTSGQHKIDITRTVANGATVSLSAFVKKGEYNFCCLYEVTSSAGRFFDLSNGTQGGTFVGAPTTSNIENYNNDWYRISISTTVPSTSARYILYVCDTISNTSFVGDNTKGIYAWGTQLEESLYPTSYIPTAGSTVTRAQETCNGAGSVSTFNDSEGVLYAEIAALADDSTNRHITLSDGSNNNRLVLKYDNQSNVIQAFNRVGGVETAFLSASVTDITLFSKCAVKYKVNDYALWIDGVEVATDTNATTFPSSTLNDLKFGESGANSNFYGRTKGIYVFNEALTDDELQQLTGPEYNSFAALAAAYNYTVI